MGLNMLVATILTHQRIRFDVTVKSAVGTRKYFTTAASSFEAWEKAAAYCGDLACAISVMAPSAQ
jgi:hypothetical protein